MLWQSMREQRMLNQDISFLVIQMNHELKDIKELIASPLSGEKLLKLQEHILVCGHILKEMDDFVDEELHK